MLQRGAMQPLQLLQYTCEAGAGTSVLETVSMQTIICYTCNKQSHRHHWDVVQRISLVHTMDHLFKRSVTSLCAFLSSLADCGCAPAAMAAAICGASASLSSCATTGRRTLQDASGAFARVDWLLNAQWCHGDGKD